MNKCDQSGHDWMVTTASGWFQCQRVVDYKGKTNKVVLCNAVAVCPGCLGFAVANVLNLFCSVHAGSDLEDFPVVQAPTTTSPADSLSYEQNSLW